MRRRNIIRWFTLSSGWSGSFSRTQSSRRTCSMSRSTSLPCYYSLGCCAGWQQFPAGRVFWFYVAKLSARTFTACVERNFRGAEGSAFNFSLVKRCLRAAPETRSPIMRRLSRSHRIRCSRGITSAGLPRLPLIRQCVLRRARFRWPMKASRRTLCRERRFDDATKTADDAARLAHDSS